MCSVRRVSGEVPVSVKERMGAGKETKIAAPIGSVDGLASASGAASVGEESRSSSKKTKVKLFS